MLSCAMILTRDVSAAPHLDRWLHHFLQCPVHTVAHAHLMLERLDMDVGGAAFHGIGEQSVDQFGRRARRRPGPVP